MLFQGPDHDEEDVQAETITEMKERKQKALEEILLKQEQDRLQEEERIRSKDAEGISWGMAEEAEEEPDLSVNPFAITTNEELFLDDPKKTLRGFFEREGLDLEYKTEDLPNQTFLCKVELPLDDDNGRPIVAQVTHKGKKKDCVAQCALEACRILDRHGVLRKANQEAAVRRKKADSDSGDDDAFLDRTGDIEKRRKRKTQGNDGAALTYDELLKQELELRENIQEIEEKIDKNRAMTKKKGTDEDTDDLDAFMSHLKEGTETVDKVQIKKYRLEQQTLQKDLKQVQRLIEITRPLELPKLSLGGGLGGEPSGAQKKHQLPLFGKKRKLDVKVEKKEETKKEEPETTIEEFDEEESEDNHKQNVVEKPQEVVIEKPEAPKRDVTHVVQAPPAPPTNLEAQSNKTQNREEDQSTAESKKKARQRIRIRKHARDNVDMEETVEETEEKFTDWLPPVDQSGDGTTALNEKLGY